MFHGNTGLVDDREIEVNPPRLHPIQERRINESISAAIGCFFRIRVDERTTVSGTVTQVQFLGWRRDEERKAKIAQFLVTIEAGEARVTWKWKSELLPTGKGDPKSFCSI